MLLSITALIAILLSCAFPDSPPPDSSAQDGLLIVFWNLENFFWPVDEGGGDADAEWSPQGARHWTFARMRRKADMIAKTIFCVKDGYGRLPDVIAVAEVENRKVLGSLVYDSPLRKAGYGIVHYDSQDRRGIDVALLYRKETLELLSSRPLHPDSAATRDVLHAAFFDGRGRLDLLVCHFPSKWGGASSEGKRHKAAQRLVAAKDSLQEAGASAVIAAGDFNDIPSSPVFGCFRAGPRPFENLAAPLEAAGRGSIRYRGRWELIDMFLVSGQSSCTMEILDFPFLLAHDKVQTGDRPFRTYTGPRYNGGVSDHLPILLRLPGSFILPVK